MNSESSSLYRLIILYTLNNVSTPLPTDILSDYIVSNNYTNFFNVQSLIGSLLDDGYIKENNTYRLVNYEITDAGKETLALFQQKIPLNIRNEIKDYLKQQSLKIADSTSVVTDYSKTKTGTYMVTCLIKDGSDIVFETKLEVATEEDALRACQNFDNSFDKLYQHALSTLLA